MKKSKEKTVFTAFLKKKGHRITAGRLAVLEVALKEKGHFDADTLYLHMRMKDSRVSRATVYRTLDLLLEAGFLSKMLTENQAMYEVIPGKGHHDHLICTKCGAIIEVVNEEIERLQKEICRKHGFTMTRHVLKIEGTCSDCL